MAKAKSSGSGRRKGWSAADQRTSPKRLVVREHRKNAELTLAQVAKELNLSLHQYSRYELNPDRFRHEHLAVLARLFSVSVDDLIEPNAMSVLPLAAVRRTVPVYTLDGKDQMLLTDQTISPRSNVSTDAYAVVAPDDTMSSVPGPRVIYRGDYCIVDPKGSLMPGDIVHVVDPHTKAHMLRFYVPLHPSNPRAPGFLLRAADPGVDEVYVAAADAAGVIRGRVVERHVLF